MSDRSARDPSSLTQPLETGWLFKRHDPLLSFEDDFSSAKGWRSASVPGTVHQDLLAHDLIPDPHLAQHEHDVQWVGQTDWLYRLEFTVDQLSQRAALCFDGLDTYAQVWLNGRSILESDNMFVPQRVAVGEELLLGRNELRICFTSAWRRGRELEAQHGGPRPLWNGDSSRLFVRKAQYHYGWDWGPTLVTAGIWRGVRLESSDARIALLHAPINLSEDLRQAQIAVQADLEGMLNGLTLQLELRDPDGALLEAATISAVPQLERLFALDAPQLWWPHLYGAQALYTLEVSLKREATVLETKVLRLGVRRLRLLEEAVQNEAGSSFVFEVNNVAIYCGGANWIPDDSFLPRITRERYAQRLTAAKDANMAMIRVWGGGIYEDDVFYDLCDQLGLLVWQDFMFACGIYPAHPSFLEGVALEATANIQRLRHHACLAIWTGNNEDYQIAHSHGLYDPSAAPAANSSFPARVIYEQLLAGLVAQHDPQRPYRPGSPWGGADPDDQLRGDRHTWEVWGRSALPYQQYKQLGGRFVSEFGMQAAPSLATLQACLEPQDLQPWSAGFENRNRATDGARRLNAYITDSLSLPSDLETYVYATQLIQSEAIGYAYRIWRREFKEPGRYGNAGALVWQLNDCWPGVSWSLIDSSGHRKMAYYAAKRELALFAVGMEIAGEVTNLWVVSGTLHPRSLQLELSSFTLGGQPHARASRTVTLEPNRAAELEPWAVVDAQPTVRFVRLLDGDIVLARAALFPEPFKYHALPDPALSVTRLSQTQVRLHATAPVKGLWLEAIGAVWDDNGFDLMPLEERIVSASSLESPEIALRWLGGQRVFEL